MLSEKRGERFTEKSGDTLPDEASTGLVKRADIHGHRRVPRGGLAARHEAVRASGGGALLGYIPVSIFTGLSVVTLGLYPYVWFAQHLEAFVSLSLERIDERALRRYVVFGILVQLLVILAAFLAVLGFAFDSPLILEYAFRFAFFYVSLTLLALIPTRSFLYFGLRWNLRRAVAAWDSAQIMLPRTMPSWWKLFLFGALYLQHHINRVIGLGMPGFADAELVREPLPFLDWLGGYLTGFNEPISKGRR